MNKILLSVALIVAVTLLSISFSKASLSDTESSNVNSFVAGTLTIADGDTTLVPFHFESLQPGDHETKLISLKNSGTVDINGLKVSAVNKTGSTGFLDQIKISVFSGSTYFTDDSSVVSTWMDNANVLNVAIHPGDIYVLSFDFKVPSDISTDWQGKSANFDMRFTAQQ